MIFLRIGRFGIVKSRVLSWAPSEGTLANSPELTVAVLQPRYAVAEDNGGPMSGRGWDCSMRSSDPWRFPA